MGSATMKIPKPQTYGAYDERKRCNVRQPHGKIRFQDVDKSGNTLALFFDGETSSIWLKLAVDPMWKHLGTVFQGVNYLTRKRYNETPSRKSHVIFNHHNVADILGLNEVMIFRAADLGFSRVQFEFISRPEFLCGQRTTPYHDFDVATLVRYAWRQRLGGGKAYEVQLYWPVNCLLELENFHDAWWRDANLSPDGQGNLF